MAGFVGIRNHFLELTITHCIRHIPSDAPRDHVAFEMAALEIDHRTIPPASCPAIIAPTDPREKFTTEPKTSLMPRRPVVSAPGPVFVDALAPLRERIAQRPPRVIRPRSLVLDFHVLWVSDILGHVWEPAEHIWRAAVTLVDGERLILERRWDAGAP
ncbi:hypothetical protein [Methylosinus sporium]|uniref:hypothetical protein n=1 Tax=Methylosinus sporium TaxID=428 RepID=UPI00383A78F9